jgi:hypothetical protein
VKKLALVILVLAAVIVMIKTGGERLLNLHGRSEQVRHAVDRVDAAFSALAATGTQATGEFQEACCMWYKGKIFLADRAELDRAELGFIDWLNANGLYRKISGYEITDAKLVESGAAVIVTGMVESKPFQIRAEPEKPLRMVK